MTNSLRILLFVFIFSSSIASASSTTWDGGDEFNNLASSPANWAGDSLPPYGDIFFDTTSAKNCTWDLNETYISLTIGAGYSGSVTLISTLILSEMFQPNGIPIPSQIGCDGGHPTGLAPLLACQCTDPGVCNIGSYCTGPSSCDTGVNSVCETTLWHSYNDNTCIPSKISGLNPWAAASVLPQTFSPVGSLTFGVVSRGTTLFQNAFGWYNAGSASPALSDLHVVSNCNSANGSKVELNIQADPAYLGGKIGFFLATPESQTAPGTCANGNCCASVERVNAGQGYIYYSERAYNPDEAGANSFIHLLIYKSKVWPDKYYFAWDDIYNGSNNDFTDLVTSVSGIGL